MPQWPHEVWAWGLSPQNVIYLPTLKHTSQECEGKLQNCQILIVSAVIICKQCLQTASQTFHRPSPK